MKNANSTLRGPQKKAFLLQTNKDLEKARKYLENLDAGILGLLEERAEAAREIGRLKKILDIVPFQPILENARLAEIGHSLKGTLSPLAVRRIFGDIIAAGRNRQISRPFLIFDKPGGAFNRIIQPYLGPDAAIHVITNLKEWIKLLRHRLEIGIFPFDPHLSDLDEIFQAICLEELHVTARVSLQDLSTKDRAYHEEKPQVTVDSGIFVSGSKRDFLEVPRRVGLVFVVEAKGFTEKRCRAALEEFEIKPLFQKLFPKADGLREGYFLAEFGVAAEYPQILEEIEFNLAPPGHCLFLGEYPVFE